jgi:hypothetical protein
MFGTTKFDKLIPRCTDKHDVPMKRVGGSRFRVLWPLLLASPDISRQLVEGGAKRVFLLILGCQVLWPGL